MTTLAPLGKLCLGHLSPMKIAFYDGVEPWTEAARSKNLMSFKKPLKPEGAETSSTTPTPKRRHAPSSSVVFLHCFLPGSEEARDYDVKLPDCCRPKNVYDPDSDGGGGRF